MESSSRAAGERPTAKRLPLDRSSSEAVIYDGTAYLTLIGPDSGDTVAEQTQSILDKIDAILAKCGTSKRKLLTANVYCTDSRFFEEVNTRWDAWVPWHDPPGCQYLVAKMRTRHHKVSIQVTAAI